MKFTTTEYLFWLVGS